MPELPEVDTIVEELKHSSLIGKTLVGVKAYWPKTVAFDSTKLKPQKLMNISRRGKWIVLQFEHGFLFIHLRMTGKFKILPTSDPILDHERAVLNFKNGTSLRFIDTRKFGRFYWSEDQTLFFENIGIEPLSEEFTPTLLKKLLMKRNRKIKPLLLDQSVIAGIGNIYADEALWEAKIHPERVASSLLEKEIISLHKGIQSSLRIGIALKGTTLGKGKSNFYRLDGSEGKHATNLKAYQKSGSRCSRCSTVMVKKTVGQRSSHFCPHCQRLF